MSWASLLAAVFLASLGPAGCGRAERHQPAPFEVTDRFPHDPTAYTQGLLWADGVLFESRVLASRALAADRFGEGLALMKDRLYQLTWESGVAYTYDAGTLVPRDSFEYAGEGRSEEHTSE